MQNSDETHDQDALAVPPKYLPFVFEEELPDSDAHAPEANTDNPDAQPAEAATDVPTRKPLYGKVQRLPLDAGEPPQGDTNDDPETIHDVNHWEAKDRPNWQLHSSLGPNTNAEGFVYKKEALQEHVNPVDYDYSQAAVGIDVEDLVKRWQKTQEEYPEYTDESLTKDNLDEYQLFFVTLVLNHMEKILHALENDLEEPEPLRLMLIGTAGTGKSTATKTLLQELRRRLRGHELEVDFFKVAAPTGTAAFNVRFNATTIHRLIHWFTPHLWSEISNPIKIDRLQKQLGQTRLVVLDEVSMVGRKMMGRIDSRFDQAKPEAHQSSSTLAGTSLVCVGDPGQCQALFDQQLYDTKPHPQTVDFTTTAELSNRGLQIYSEFDKYIILNQVHRVNIIKDPQTQEDHDYNERAQNFLHLLHRVRDLEISQEDYYRLC